MSVTFATTKPLVVSVLAVACVGGLIVGALADEPADGVPATRTIDAGGLPLGVRWSADGKTIASTVLTGDQPDTSPEERAWDVGNGRRVAVRPTVGNTSPDGKLKVTPGERHEPGKGTVWFVSVGVLATGRERTVIAGTPIRSANRSHGRALAAVTFSPDSRLLATGQFDGRVCVWDAGTGKLVRELLDHDKACTGLTFTPDGERLLSSSNDGTLCVYEGVGWELVHTLEHKDGITSFVVAPGGKDVLTCAGNLATLWRTSTGERRVVAKAASGLRCAGFSPDGKRFAAGTDGEPGAIWVWDAETGRLRHTLSGELKSVIGLAFSPDGKWLASGDASKTVRLWHLRD